ncbi:PEPxxWA-CTERM sorting domain-containing protein [Roseateles amylovorans]|uniref:PEPxxWA-CTERM sorting domain-containing protein n=1 Tax=Roseateles amylovorans TaxID=2978473 RepID=A0ABY6AYL2_9BURK|nr:PEPxxWA-CTERM sorting domain-containing protein [Roseateles amylovorans]UXH77368.1 PEPxxWA-CTERM sorting domain-containing protein [Roseateles amylovorans]
MNFKPLLLAAAAFIALSANATVVAQWDYNKGSTKHSVSQNGASFSTLGGVTTTFVSQSGSSDPNAGQAMNTTTYGGATTGNMTRGVQYGIDTSGYEHLVLSFDQRNSSTASAWTALLYTVDGENWSQATTFHMTTDGSFVKGLSYDFSSVTGAANNESFAIRLVSMFAPGLSSYLGTSGNYASGGTIRYDMVTLSGTEIVASAVPEPASIALMLAGLGLVGVAARRRRQDA